MKKTAPNISPEDLIDMGWKKQKGHDAYEIEAENSSIEYLPYSKEMGIYTNHNKGDDDPLMFILEIKSLEDLQSRVDGFKKLFA